MLNFDIDASELRQLQDNLGATDKEVRMAFNRALKRTAATLRKMSQKGLRTELGLRNAKAIRKRLRTIKLRRAGVDGIQLWYGTNDMLVSAFKGSPRKGRKRDGGASFRGQQFPGGFIAKGRGGKRTIYKRRGDGRLPIREQTLKVKDKMDVFLEDDIFTEVEHVFMKHFRTDLRGRILKRG